MSTPSNALAIPGRSWSYWCFIFSTWAFLLVACRPDNPQQTKLTVTNPIAVSDTVAYPAIVQYMINDGFCTGTFIATNALLTAAHCVQSKIPQGTIEIFLNPAGSYQIKQRQVRYIVHANRFDILVQLIKKVLPHAEMPWTSASDVAILIFDHPQIPASQVQRLAVTPLENNTPVTLVGYGEPDNIDYKGATQQQHIGYNQYSAFETLTFLNTLNQGYFSFEGWSKGDIDLTPGQQSSIGSGDSGGPLLDLRGDLIGVASNSRYPVVNLLNKKRSISRYAYLLHPATQRLFLTAKTLGADIPLTCCRCRKVSANPNRRTASRDKIQLGFMLVPQFVADETVDACATATIQSQSYALNRLTAGFSLKNCQPIAADLCLAP